MKIPIEHSSDSVVWRKADSAIAANLCKQRDLSLEASPVWKNPTELSHGAFTLEFLP